jgi:type VI secretion system secreted protein VgrG
MNQDCRLFQDMSVVEITDAVLAAYTFPVDKRLTTPRPNSAWPKRDIQRQHWESDFTFLARLWQEWGIYFWFEHSDGKHRLVLCDSIGAHQPHGEAYRTLRYEAPTGRRIDEEHIHALSIRRRRASSAGSTSDASRCGSLATRRHRTATCCATRPTSSTAVGASGPTRRPGHEADQAVD